jgi:GDP-L-fucose synthase
MESNSKADIKHSALRKSSRIFVAGGTGLVGSAIIKNLLEKGYTNIIANYHSRVPEGSALNTNSVRYVKLDLLDSSATKAFFKSESPEFVFLAAAKVGGIVANNTYRADFIYENLQMQNNIIHQSYESGVKKLMFLGSTCIYPKNAPQPMPEECLLTGTLEYTNEPYAIAKIAGIKMCESFNLQYGTNYISVMPTNLYGPNDNFDLEKSHVLPALIRKIHLGRCLKENDWDAVRADLDRLPVKGIDGKAGKKEILGVLSSYGLRISDQGSHPAVQVEIWGTGAPRREFLWSEDMADACVFLMENRDFKDTYKALDGSNTTCTPNKVQNREIRNTHINIGTGIDISIKELAEMISDIVGFDGELYFNADKPDGTMKKLTDPSKLHSLGWHHKVGLEDGIRMMYEWYTGS